jgi:hypothetical protein
VARLTQAINRLFQQLVILTAVRVMALDTAAALNIVGIGHGVFIPIRTGDITVTIFANTPEAVRLILVSPFGESVATQAGHGALLNRMAGTAHESEIRTLMTAAAEFGLVVLQQTHDRGRRMELVAVRAVDLLERVRVESKVVHVLVREMACDARGERLVTG